MATKNQMGIQNNFLFKSLNKIRNGIKLRFKYLSKNYYIKKLINQLIYLYKLTKPKYLYLKRIFNKIYPPISLFIKNHTKIVSVSIIMLILLFFYIINNKNTYAAFLFYPDNSNSYLKYERREVIKDFKKEERIRNTIDELLLGPISPEFDNIFPKESKLLSLRLEDDKLFLNFNKSTIMDFEWEDIKGYSPYKLLLNSIVNTVSFQFREIKKVKIYFDGKEYKYIGDVGPIDDGLFPDWSIFHKYVL